MNARAESEMRYKIRKATLIDAPAIGELIKISARGLSAEDYTSEQIEGALRGAFGVDSDLIKDGTYFVTEAGDVLVGCGGWSYRKKLFGGDTLASEEAGKLDPRTDSAKIRAFFVHPLWARKGIAKAILLRCEEVFVNHTDTQRGIRTAKAGNFTTTRRCRGGEKGYHFGGPL